MSPIRIDFESMSWDEAREGVRMKTYCEGGRQVRLVEFSTAQGPDGWCQHGHIGYVLAGGLTIDVAGKLHAFTAGDGLFIPSGAATAHRGVTIQPGTRLLMIEDV
jgi:quercetin dioxygenase-like cupin family protein